MYNQCSHPCEITSQWGNTNTTTSGLSIWFCIPSLASEFTIWQTNVFIIITVHFILTENMPFCSSRDYPIWHTTRECDSHHFGCHLVSRLPQVLLLHCVPLHPRWLRRCHPTCWQWHLPHSDLPPTWHHLQDWGGGSKEGRRSRRTEGKGHGTIPYCNCKWVPAMGCI